MAQIFWIQPKDADGFELIYEHSNHAFPYKTENEALDRLRKDLGESLYAKAEIYKTASGKTFIIVK